MKCIVSAMPPLSSKWCLLITTFLSSLQLGQLQRKLTDKEKFDIEEKLVEHGIINEITLKCPDRLIHLGYDNGKFVVNLGDKVDTDKIAEAPFNVSFGADSEDLYTLVMFVPTETIFKLWYAYIVASAIKRTRTKESDSSPLIRNGNIVSIPDHDAPVRSAPVLRSFIHWMVGNIPGTGVMMGHTFYEYYAPKVFADTGVHRYVWLIYRQTNFIEFKLPKIDEKTDALRGHFNHFDFMKQHKFKSPYALTFFECEYAENKTSTDKTA